MTRRDVVTAGGVRLAYSDTGAADRPVLVLLHALGEDRSTWEPVAGPLSERFRLLAFDLRGHGDSDWPGQYGFRLMRDDVVDALGQLGLDRVALLGHSMGAVVCYLLAAQQPGRVELLVVEDAPPPYERDRPVPVRDDEAVGFDWPVVPAVIGEVNAGDPELWAALPSIAAPTLVIGGGPDSHVPQERLAEVAALVPDSTLVTIPVGHHVHSEDPAAFVRAVLGWLERVSAAPTQ